MQKSVKITLRVTEDMMELMRQALRKTTHKNINEFLRECIRAYLDETGDIIGSRRHFNKRMNDRMDKLESMIVWHSLQTQTLTARGLFTVLDELAPEDAEKDPPTPDIQLRMAGDHSRQLLAKFLQDEAPIVNDITEYRRKLAKEKKK